MKLTIAPTQQESKDEGYPTISVEVENDDLNLDDVVELIRDLLAAWGYSSSSIEKVFSE